ncbi:MAG: glycosyltransferase [Bacteroidales bacterium]|jgi:glycosyltransferase involved in cell wall biosynthesis|nr:glycosyltransferase [Bacteroidales bacterium]
MAKKNLVLLCDNYPLSTGEFFIDDEMKVLAPHFQKIIVLIKKQKKTNNLNRYIPENLEVVTYKENITLKTKIFGLWNIFRPFFIKEWFWTLQKYKFKQWISVFKIMYMDVLRAQELQKQIEKNAVLDFENTICYSYWHDYKALALAFMRKKYPIITTIARAHRWDIYFEENKIPYLPFKQKIILNLSKTISISQDGKDYFNRLLNDKLNHNITVSRLGKFNNRSANNQKQENQVLICSCSTLIEVKRVSLIIDILAQLHIENLKWVHFGDGILREEIEKYAQEKLKAGSYEFKGIVSNNEILDFYAENYVDLFINTSESEGIPVSIMEALSAGIPVVATNVGGTAEAVNNENGFLLEKDFDVTNTANLIRNYLLSSVEKQLQYRENAYNSWKENYEAEKNYNSFVNEILQLSYRK